jgi:glutathione S-transferase
MLSPVHRLYVVQSSHPCEAVKRALELKAIPFKAVELLIPTQAVIMRLLFADRTVPALRLDGGEKVQGSRAILRRLDELVPEPALLPAGEAERAAVVEAERWGEETLQQLARRVTWAALKRRPDAIPSYQEASQLPRLPGPVVRLVAPAVIRVETAMNRARDAVVRADLDALPAHLDRVDAWIAGGVLGGASPNAADLQIGSSLRLLTTLGDVRPLLAGRPAEALAMKLFPDFPGDVPAGAYPAGWLPERASTAA